ncbi:MAG: FecR domain-containing protein [Eubacteriales bacterium]|nr:FecR domain-containing protein [Eubacteriales bacterium]
MEKNGKKKWIVISIVAVVAIIAVCLIVVFTRNKKEAYRLIKVFDLDGRATISRAEIGDIDAYQNMVLESGDEVFQNEGMMTLKLDEDKYVYVEEQTRFSLVATGDGVNSKTTIELEQGAITNELQNKLPADASYEINTPNSSMSVRGTTYRVCTYLGEDGITYTVVAVFEGTVTTRLCYPDGTIADEEVSIEKGKQIIIYEDAETTDYLTGVEDIDYSIIPEDVLINLIEISENGTELSLTTDELKALLEKGPYTVTFMYNGSVFGTQTVENGAYAQVPTLNPALSGGWDFDFSTPITEDTEIHWK